jgi:hypothetical protein
MRPGIDNLSGYIGQMDSIFGMFKKRKEIVARAALHATVQNPGSNMHQNMHQIACIPATRLDLYPREERVGKVQGRQDHSFFPSFVPKSYRELNAGRFPVFLL